MKALNKNTVFCIIAIGIFFASCDSSKKTTYTNSTVSKLEGTWELNYISGKTIAFDSLYPNKKPIITFDIANKLTSGSTGCNNFNGPIKLDDNRISFTDPMAMTRMMCSDIKGENVFLETLKKINNWSVKDNNTLNLLMDDVGMMRFTKK